MVFSTSKNICLLLSEEMKPSREMSSDGDDGNREEVEAIEDMSASTSKEDDDKEEHDNLCSSESQEEQVTVVVHGSMMHEESIPNDKQDVHEETEILPQLTLSFLPSQSNNIAPNLPHPSAPPPADFQSPPVGALVLETSSSSCQCKTPYVSNYS